MGQIFYSCAYDIDTKTCCGDLLQIVNDLPEKYEVIATGLSKEEIESLDIG